MTKANKCTNGDRWNCYNAYGIFENEKQNNRLVGCLLFQQNWKKLSGYSVSKNLKLLMNQINNSSA